MKSRFGFLTWNPPWKHWKPPWNPLWDFEIYCKIQISQLNPLFIDKCMVILRLRKKSIPPPPPMDDHWKFQRGGGVHFQRVFSKVPVSNLLGGGGWRCKSKSLLWGVWGYGYFLEVHISNPMENNISVLSPKIMGNHQWQFFGSVKIHENPPPKCFQFF